MSLLEKPMFLLRSFSLSISILWRFILVLPLWTLFYAVITAVSVIGTYTLLPILGLFALFIFPLLAMVVIYIISMHPYLIGIRIGLEVLGIETKTSSKRLLTGAVGFGFLEGIVASVLLSILLAGNILLVQREFDLLGTMQVERIADPVAKLSRQISIGALATLPILNSLIVMALRATLLPTLANFVTGRNPRGHLRGILDGLGANFITMMLLMLMITGISAVVIPFLGDAFQYIGLTSVLLDGLRAIILFDFAEQEISFTLAHASIVFGAIILSIWLFSLQCAGAALSYQSRANEIATEKQSKELARQDRPEDMAALRRSRMPNHTK